MYIHKSERYIDVVVDRPSPSWSPPTSCIYIYIYIYISNYLTKRSSQGLLLNTGSRRFPQILNCTNWSPILVFKVTFSISPWKVILTL